LIASIETAVKQAKKQAPKSPPFIVSVIST
jgi:hypothetical protein